MSEQNDWQRRVTEELLPESHKKFSEHIGLEATLALCEAFGGEQIYIPRNDRVRQIVRTRDIREDFKRGVRVTALAHRYGITESAVQEIVRDLRNKQMSIFDPI